MTPARITTILLACLLCTSVLAAENEWEPRRDRNGIEVFTRAVDGSPYDEVRTLTVIDGVRLSSLVALIEDLEACADWADKCAESYLFERISDTESLIYTHNNMPFPVRDRDVVASIKWMQDAESLEIKMFSAATVGKMEKVKGRLRLTDATASWGFRPLSDGSIEISNQAHINPGSRLPGWLTNMLLVDTPFETMLAFIDQVKKPKYRDAQFSFIKEPAE